MDYIQELKRTGLLMSEKSKKVHKKLYRTPQGRILISRDKDCIRIRQVILQEDGSVVRKSIKKQPELLMGLSTKAFLSEYVRRLDYDITLLKDCIKKMQPLDYENIVKSLPKNYELIPDEYKGKWIPSKMHPIFSDAVNIRRAEKYIKEEEQKSWAAIPYRANTYSMNLMKYKTPEGFRMRSKSEISIFNIYVKHGFAVHYDELLDFNGIIKSPDFVAMRYDGKIIIHEHCGYVNDEYYMKKHEDKMKLYRECGFVPWDNLIVTYDSPEGGIDLKLVEAEICAKLDR